MLWLKILIHSSQVTSWDLWSSFGSKISSRSLVPWLRGNLVTSGAWESTRTTNIRRIDSFGRRIETVVDSLARTIRNLDRAARHRCAIFLLTNRTPDGPIRWPEALWVIFDGENARNVSSLAWFRTCSISNEEDREKRQKERKQSTGRAFCARLYRPSRKFQFIPRDGIISNGGKWRGGFCAGLYHDQTNYSTLLWWCGFHIDRSGRADTTAGQDKPIYEQAYR